ncbi:MAG: rhomboid family intramembrane serine protease [Bacilli bacterium]|nr:rhomboid family intramembrane serine protease [Bacilli bacterium]
MTIEGVIEFFKSTFSYHSIVTIGYFFVCFGVFILNVVFKNKITKLFQIRRGSFLNPMNYIRLVTSGVCHADFQHFRNNFIFILLLGPILEERFGSLVFLEMILITTVASSLFHLLFYESSAIGASDVVYMMVVLCGIICSFDGRIPITFVLLFLFFVFEEIVKMFFHKKNDSVGHDGHVIGAICGIVFGYHLFLLGV